MSRRLQAAARRGRSSVVVSIIVVPLLLVVVATAVGAAQAQRRAAPAEDPSGPKVTVAAPALSTSASAKSGFTVKWAAAPALPSGGWDAYRVEYREPGVGYWLMWEEAIKAGSAAFPGEPGHAYEFRAAAVKTSDKSVVGPWSAVKPVAVPADDASFTVTKKWTRAAASGAYLGKVRSSTVKGATATFTFKGTKAALIAPRGPALGKVAVHVCSAKAGGGWTAYKKVKTIDLYAKKAKARVATVIGSHKPDVERQVKLVVTGTKNKKSKGKKVSLDGLAVYGAPHAAGEYALKLEPSEPSVAITETLKLTAGIPGSVEQRVTWELVRYDRFGAAHTDHAGTITAGGVYTAPEKPTNTQGSAGDDYRRYYVTARAVANPDELVEMREIRVKPWPGPEFDGDASPKQGAAGSSVTFRGDYFTHPDPDADLRVYFSTRELEVTGHTKTSVTVKIPSQWDNCWDPTMTAYVWATTADPSPSSWHHFTVTGIKPSPPSPEHLRVDDNASIGDEIQVYGMGFAPEAAQNRVRFGGGVEMTASRYERDVFTQYSGTLYVRVPAGASTGPLTFRRLDSDSGWSTKSLMFTVVPATQPIAALHPSFNGRYTGPRLVSNGRWSISLDEEDWLLAGSNFTKLRISADAAPASGVFWLDIRHDGKTYSRIMRAVSDTLAVPHRGQGEQEMFPERVFGDLPAGTVLEIRVRGDELTNRYERTSEWTPVTIATRPYYGSLVQLRADDMVGWWGPSKTIARGSWLWIRPGAGPATETQPLTAPGLWSGELPMSNGDGIRHKLVPLTANGTYTITNQRTGQSTQLVVADVGPPQGGGYGSDTVKDLHTAGLKMRVDGAELTVPPGAFWEGDLTQYQDHFGLRLEHYGSPATPWDTTLTDGDHIFSLSITPTVTRLLKPITVTIPYDPAGRGAGSAPFLGMWDNTSKLYYDFRVSPAQVDTANHKITYVIPSGTYPATTPSGAPARAAKTRAASVAPIPAAAPMPAAAPAGRSFNDSFRQVGAVSFKVDTSGEDFVWDAGNGGGGIRVDAVIDPDSSSYVPEAKARRVLNVARDTWENLRDKGWSEPDSMINITVRDYGDPGVYQGATTKGVFGQPWVYVNSRLAAGKKLDTAVSHEMGHVFQRQLTTNISTKWIDEAVAEWVAWDTLGSGCDLQASFEAGCDFPAVAFPGGFWSGYSTEQAYGAGAFIIWLADRYGPARVLDIYDTLAFRPTYWYDAPATFAEVTGKTVSELVFEFAPQFWLQTYEPIRTFTWSSRLIESFTDYNGKTRALAMPADSSRGLAFGPQPAFASQLDGRSMVARAPGLPVGAQIDIYFDNTGVSALPQAPQYVGMLTSDSRIVDLGVYQGGCYRLVAVTPPGAPLSASVTVEAVHLASVSPASVPKAGGTSVTLSGCGFGDQDQQGYVMVGPADVRGAAITTWTDTSITFTMPNMGDTTGVHQIEVRPLIGGPSNTRPITVTVN